MLKISRFLIWLAVAQLCCGSCKSIPNKNETFLVGKKTAQSYAEFSAGFRKLGHHSPSKLFNRSPTTSLKHHQATREKAVTCITTSANVREEKEELPHPLIIFFLNSGNINNSKLQLGTCSRRNGSQLWNLLKCYNGIRMFLQRMKSRTDSKTLAWTKIRSVYLLMAAMMDKIDSIKSNKNKLCFITAVVRTCG